MASYATEFVFLPSDSIFLMKSDENTLHEILRMQLIRIFTPTLHFLAMFVLAANASYTKHYKHYLTN